ncbi:hypothetical protein DYB38_008220 [Aphanomyces astaci]|uniref:E2 ubiquitin-conjugating enzyme n=1 Tax=Aphanomyces astaci TaxID=112090 RepID=A0A397C3Q9_APHAT|nr:hypothetical protein DYB38_008220 [Aphanomyces astaci]
MVDEDTRNALMLFTYTFGVGSLSMGHIFAATGSILGSVALSCLATPIAFLVLAGTELLPNIAVGIDVHLTPTQWIIATAICMLPLVYIPTLRDTAVLCILGSLSTLCTDGIALTVNFVERPLGPRESHVSLSSAFSAFGSIMFAFGSALLIPPLYRQCSAVGSHHLVTTVSTTLVYVTVLYMFIGILTYAQFGCMAPTTLLEAMPRGSWKVVANACMLVHIAIAYPVIMSPTLFVIERCVFGKDSDVDTLKEKLLDETKDKMTSPDDPSSPSSVASAHLMHVKHNTSEYKSVESTEQHDVSPSCVHLIPLSQPLLFRPASGSDSKFVRDVLHDSLTFTAGEHVCRMLLRTFIVAAQCFLAVMLQTSFADILTLIGATTVTLPCLIMPCVCFLRMFAPDGTWIGAATRGFSYVVIAVSAVLGVYSTYFAVANIQSNWATYHIKELEECQRGVEVSGVSASLRTDGVYDALVGTIRGPAGTPYEGGHFVLEINIPKTYPFEPPKVRFDTKIWHPNISSQTGAICLDILKDAWSPALTIKTTLLSIQALLSAAEPTDPQDAEVARMYINDKDRFNNTAAFWTQSYATEKGDAGSDAVQRLVDMGFPKDQVRQALAETKGDENAAVERLLTSL